MSSPEWEERRGAVFEIADVGGDDLVRGAGWRGWPQLWDQVIWPPIPSSWGLKEGILCVAPSQILGTARHNDVTG